MISHLPLRLAASAITLATVLSPHAARCSAPIFTKTTTAQVNDLAIASSALEALIPGLSGPHAARQID